MSLPRPASPRALLSDLRSFAVTRSPHHWIAAVLAIVMPVAIVVVFYLDGQTNLMPGRQITYVESWSLDRTDAQIKADQIRRREEAEARAAKRQEQFKKIDRALSF
jgi:hypothetical protein